MGGFQNRLADVLRPEPAGDAPREPLARQITIVAAACVVSLAVAAGDRSGVLRGWHSYPWPLRVADIVFGVLGYVGLWWRHRWPLAFAGYIAVTSVFSTLTGGLPFIAAFVVASLRNWPTALVMSAVITAAAWPSLLLYPDGSSSDGAVMLTVVAVMSAVTGWGMFIRARRQLLASLRGRAERAEQSREEHAEHAKLAERQRIAREMHDVLAHRLSLLAVQAGALEVTPAGPADGADGTVHEAAAAVRATTHQALGELRSIVRVLRDGSESSTSPPPPGAADLPALVAESAAATTVHADWGGVELAAVPAQVGRTLYRIVQEGLTNARKHAPASSVDVSVHGAPVDGLSVTVSSWLPVDRPAGRRDRAGSGLIGLRERASLAGGQLNVAVTSDDRFQLSAWLPWPGRPES